MKLGLYLALIVASSDAAATWAQPAEATSPEATQPNAAPPATAVAGDDGKISFNFETDFNSRYVFRGLALSEGPVVQPGLYLTKRDYTLGFWANINASRRGGAGAQARQANELNVTFVKSIEHGRTTIEPGLLLYLYPTGISPTTGELSLHVARRVGRYGVFSNHSVDVLEYKGAYFGEIGLSREHEWSSRLSGEAKISIGGGNAKYNEVNIGPRRSGFNVAALDLSVTRMIGDFFYVRPHLSYTKILGRKLQSRLDEPTIWNLGLAVGSDF